MAQEIINVGTAPNDGAGDPLRTAFTKTNNNFSQLFATGGVSGIANGTSNVNIVFNGAILMSPTGTANVVAVTAAVMTVTGTLIGNSAISATGNITAGNFFIGNGSQLTGVLSSPAASLITGSTLSSNVTISSLTTLGTLGSLDVTANVQAGNLRTSGQVSTAGNVNASNFNAATAVSAAGNITGANIGASSTISAAGNITGNWTLTAGSRFNATYADLAERFEADAYYDAGTVVEMGGDKEITAVQYELSEDVFGVVSTTAGYLMNAMAGDDDTHPAIAVGGRVQVKVTGKVTKGQRLVSAGNGMARAAQKGEATAFNIIGRSLEDKLTDEIGAVEAFVKIN